MPRVLFLIAAALAGACASTGATPRPFPTPRPPAAGAPNPNSGTPNSGTPNSGTPNSATPNSATPNSTHGTLKDPAASSPIAYSVTSTALALRGAPYKNGGSDPSGFDCSGLVRYVFTQHGITVPRTVSEQFRAGTKVDGKQVEPGDLVFFSTVAPGASHVGIAIGGDEFVHAPSGAGEVRVERMSAPYWAARFVGARRML